jgi:hypothetical protein
MKRVIVASILSFVLLFAFGSVAYGEMAKEGTISGTLTYAGTHKIIPLDKNNFVFTYENRGVRVSDSREGPFHGMSTHNQGIMYFEKGVGRLRGYLISVDKDGDKMITELTEENSQLGGPPTSGTGKIVGGTGKFKGIQGEYEYTRQNMYPVAEGTHQAVSKFKGNYKIVETKE